MSRLIPTLSDWRLWAGGIATLPLLVGIGVLLGLTVQEALLALLTPIVIIAPPVLILVQRYLHAAYVHDGKRSIWLRLLRNTVRMKMVPTFGMAMVACWRILDLISGGTGAPPQPWSTAAFSVTLVAFVIVPIYWWIELTEYERRLRMLPPSQQDPDGIGMPNRHKKAPQGSGMDPWGARDARR